MSGRRRAWVYCSIDAPEDENDMLKKQREQLWEYAGQMGFEVAGSSSDTGRIPLWERSERVPALCGCRHQRGGGCPAGGRPPLPDAFVHADGGAQGAGRGLRPAGIFPADRADGTDIGRKERRTAWTRGNLNAGRR